jgi:hypothetical protein
VVSPDGSGVSLGVRDSSSDGNAGLLGVKASVGSLTGEAELSLLPVTGWAHVPISSSGSSDSRFIATSHLETPFSFGSAYTPRRDDRELIIDQLCLSL